MPVFCFGDASFAAAPFLGVATATGLFGRALALGLPFGGGAVTFLPPFTGVADFLGAGFALAFGFNIFCGFLATGFATFLGAGFALAFGFNIFCGFLATGFATFLGVGFALAFGLFALAGSFLFLVAAGFLAPCFFTAELLGFFAFVADFLSALLTDFLEVFDDFLEPDFANFLAISPKRSHI
jgi:hypothetical protein